MSPTAIEPSSLETTLEPHVNASSAQFPFSLTAGAAAWQPRRRGFLLGGGALFGSTLLGGLTACGGGDDDGDPIWGESGAATKIIDALKSVSQSSFPVRDFAVTAYGALPCTVVTARTTWLSP